MCGITGIVDVIAKREISSTLVKAMNKILTHRGPDGDGFHFEPGVALGHRRLSIIDLAGGKQPLYNEDKSVVVTYNGEIYNFRELEDELRKLGHNFRTRCDTEVIVHAWEEWGPECLSRFNGMFAFAIWDSTKQELFLARDRLGIKPLFYRHDQTGFLHFASELKALTVDKSLNQVIDPRAVEDFFAFGYIPDPLTIYKGVYKLEPGCFLHVKRGIDQTPSPKRYWDVPLDKPADITDAKEACAHIVANLKDAVKRRLISDVPLGAFLSGGIDSSAVVAMMAECDIKDILTCSIGFTEPRYDESQYADLVADQKRTRHHKEIVESSDYDLLDILTGTYDEPFADSSAIPTYRVCELARKHVTVALSGDGGDENFIGYRRYRLFDMEDSVRRRIPAGVRTNVFGPLGRMYPKLDWAPRVFRAKTTFEGLTRDATEAYRHAVNITKDVSRARLFSEPFKQSLNGHSAANVFKRYVEDKEFENNLRLVQYLDFKTYLPGDILTKVDRASMAHSLEVRVPFLDYTFVESAARMTTNLKLANGETKAILKKSMEPYLPKDVLYRKKMGFAVPLDIWFRDSLREVTAKSVCSERMMDSGVFDSTYLKKLVKDHQSGRSDYSATLWSLLIFDKFLAAHA